MAFRNAKRIRNCRAIISGEQILFMDHKLSGTKEFGPGISIAEAANSLEIPVVQ